jgi:hypothetical protein
MLEKFKDIKSLMNDPQLPKSISEIIIHDGVDFNHRAYNYNWTRITDGKKYWGWHKDKLGWYWQSCMNVDFINTFAGNEPILKLEIVSSGTVDYEEYYESFRLRESSAASSTDFFNGNNGMKKNITVEQQKLSVKVKNDIDKIEEQTSWNKNDFKGNTWKQTRKQALDHKHAAKFKDSLEKNPNVDEWEPLIFLKDYTGKGKDLGIGGRHRFHPWVKHTKTTTIPVKEIPFEVWKGLTDFGVGLLGNVLNDPDGPPKMDSKPEDFEDAIYNSYMDLKEVKGKHIKDWFKINNWPSFLSDRGFTSTSISGLKRTVTKRISNLDVAPGMEFRQYSEEEQTEYVDNLKKQYPDWTISEYSTDVPILERLTLKDLKPKKNNLMFVAFHPSFLVMKEWKRKKNQMEDLNTYYNHPVSNLLNDYPGVRDIIGSDLNKYKINLMIDEPKHLFPKIDIKL